MFCRSTLIALGLLASALFTAACEDPKSCSTCSDADGTQFCVECPTPDLCIASIEEEESGEVIFECEEAPGESCATDALVANCPDL